ncbi:MAG TPA: hypothetical protein VMI54_07655 [Polyangiaceae bacterium]|nr:hypothetical protein [Polyangiaceae bacterium]
MSAEVDLSADVSAFFAGLVGEALEERRVEATDATRVYVSGLLADYAKPGALTRGALERPLTLLLAEAKESVGRERFERLRALGDGTLYVCGFFSEHLENRGVALRYVESIGAEAYDGAASMLRQSGVTHVERSSAPDVFGELAAHFEAFVGLIECIADRLVAKSGTSTNGGVVKLYERWLRTGSNELAAALGAKGLVPLRGGGGVH